MPDPTIDLSPIRRLTGLDRLLAALTRPGGDGPELDAELLDRTAIAFEQASNRMRLGMGRPSGAGKPELRVQADRAA